MNASRTIIWPLLLLLAAASLTTTGCGGDSSAKPTPAAATPATATGEEETEAKAEEDAIAVEVGAVIRDTLSQLYTTSATLRADKQATVTARTQGVIRELHVEEGQWVERGQALAVLEDDEQRIAYGQAKTTWDNKQRVFERASKLHGQGLMSDEEYETARREAEETRHAAELAELTLSRTVIRATFSGQVMTRHLDVGATVNDGTAVYDLADLSPLYADVQVPERQVATLKSGTAVRLLTDQGEESGTAVIERIAPMVDTATGTIKVTVAVRKARGLRPGSFVRLAMVTDVHSDTLVVPRTALVAEGRRWHLFRVSGEDGKTVERIEVSRGFEDTDRVEVLLEEGAGSALSVGDQVVILGASSLSDGATIKLMNQEAPGVGA
ncbi:hypothetical protein ABI59_22575 [Acidobacteria bacterium Mor1]|nr:hypothetical protein ABI59_22575 [Acidobacteria bacterium Mor1]